MSNKEILGVIGNPIKHTLSPVIHNNLSELMDINAVYTAFNVEEDLGAAIGSAYSLGIKGLNITVPYKQEVMQYCTEIDELAEKIGAVNTLVRTDSGFKGYNTDMPGLARALKSKGVSLEGRKIIVLGAGGAARAVCTMLVSEGADTIYLVNRTIAKAEAISSQYENIVPVAQADYKSIPDDRYIFIQCTSLGLKEGDGLLIDDDEFYKMADYGYDLIYNPAVTPFISKLNSLGIQTDNGLSMLLYQGIIAYEYWFNVSVSDEISGKVYEKLQQALEDGTSLNQNVVLIGYMGSGKTTVGKAIAEKYGMVFLDTDDLIVKTTGKTIPEIFEESGEQGFRDIETELLRKISSLGFLNTVISTGGGIVLRAENAELLKKIGKVNYLKATPETTFERVKGDTNRPLLKAEDEEGLRARITQMISDRMSKYEAAADVTIVTDDGDLNRVIKDIMNM